MLHYTSIPLYLFDNISCRFRLLIKHVIRCNIMDFTNCNIRWCTHLCTNNYNPVIFMILKRSNHYYFLHLKYILTPIVLYFYLSKILNAGLLLVTEESINLWVILAINRLVVLSIKCHEMLIGGPQMSCFVHNPKIISLLS